MRTKEGTSGVVKYTATEVSVRVRQTWDARGYPADEYQAALGWAGTISRLFAWFQENEAECNRIRAALQREPLSETVRSNILAARDAFNADPQADVPTPLDFARGYGIPLAVVWYIIDGEPKIDTQRRPWVRRAGRN